MPYPWKNYKTPQDGDIVEVDMHKASTEGTWRLWDYEGDPTGAEYGPAASNSRKPGRSAWAKGSK